MFSWSLSEGRERPRFDASQRRYAVRSDSSQWIARIAEFDSGPFQIRAVLSVDDWVGQGGIVWGLRADQSAFPKKQYRCWAVMYYRTVPTDPAKLAVRELVLTQFSFDDVRETWGRFVDVQEITPPAGPGAVLQVTVEDDGLLIKFDERTRWRPVDQLNRTGWLPDGKTAFGITGRGGDVVLRDLSIRSLP